MTKRIIAAICLLLLVTVFFTGCGMNDLPTGEYIKSSVSPEGTYIINAYVCNGGATTDFSVRCEAQTISTGETRNIYWQYHRQDVEIEWLSDTEVKINEIKLDVTKDSYDWRN